MSAQFTPGPWKADELQRLARAAENVAGAELDSPNFEAFLCELQEAVKPFKGVIDLPRVGSTVHYFNPSYEPKDNEHTGIGPYAAIVTRAWDYHGSIVCNLKVVTPGKDALAEVGSVPERGSQMDDGKYPCWERVQPNLDLRTMGDFRRATATLAKARGER